VDAIHLPVGLTLPSAFGAPAAPLQTGQVIQALVLELIESDIFRLQLPQAVIDVRSSVPLTPGSTITLAVKGTGPSARLAIYTDVPSVPSGPVARGPAAAPNLTGRTPIGEAVVIARAPAGQGAATSGQGAALAGRNAAPPARTAGEPALPREAQTSTAAPAARQIEPPIRLVTAEQAVTEAIQTAAPRQAGLAPLFADITRVAQAAEDVPSPVPAPVRNAAADVLSLRVPLREQLTAADVKQAFVRSGILFEPKLVAAATPPRGAGSAPAASLPETEARPAQAEPSIDPATAPTPQDDLKAALLVLRQVLKAWAPADPAAARPVSNSVGGPAPDPAQAQAPASQGGAPIARDVQAIRQIASALAGLPEELVPARALSAGPLSADEATGLARTLASALTARDTAPVRQMPSSVALAPPYRGAPLIAQAVAAPTIAPDAPPHEIAGRLVAETDGALARQTLLQVASLPEQSSQPRAEAAQRWNFEVPFATPQGTAIAQFEVSRDARAARADPQARTWRARFSIDVEPMGPVHAMIALSGARTSVTLWAERAATAARLNDHAPRLSEALRSAELEPVDFSARLGAPPVARQAVPGRFMDRAS
jgi:hypothetical protein